MIPEESIKRASKVTGQPYPMPYVAPSRIPSTVKCRVVSELMPNNLDPEGRKVMIEAPTINGKEQICMSLSSNQFRGWTMQNLQVMDEFTTSVVDLQGGKTAVNFLKTNNVTQQQAASPLQQNNVQPVASIPQPVAQPVVKPNVGLPVTQSTTGLDQTELYCAKEILGNVTYTSDPGYAKWLDELIQNSDSLKTVLGTIYPNYTSTPEGLDKMREYLKANRS